MSTSRRRPGRPSNPVSRDQLIRLARQIFAQHGYAGASMSRIAEGAGIRKSSLFHHFATKEALYEKLWITWRAATVTTRTVPETSSGLSSVRIGESRFVPGIESQDLKGGVVSAKC